MSYDTNNIIQPSLKYICKSCKKICENSNNKITCEYCLNLYCNNCNHFMYNKGTRVCQECKYKYLKILNKDMKHFIKWIYETKPLMEIRKDF